MPSSEKTAEAYSLFHQWLLVGAGPKIPSKNKPKGNGRGMHTIGGGKLPADKTLQDVRAAWQYVSSHLSKHEGRDALKEIYTDNKARIDELITQTETPA